MGNRQIAFFGASFQDTQLSVERWAQGWQSNIVSIIIWFAITQKLSSHNGHQLFQFCNQRLSLIIFLFVISSFNQLEFFSSFNQVQFILSTSVQLAAALFTTVYQHSKLWFGWNYSLPLWSQYLIQALVYHSSWVSTQNTQSQARQPVFVLS